jgi:hypothetical protein
MEEGCDAMTKLSFEIQFNSPNVLTNGSIPVEVRRPNLTLAATGLTSENIELEPGSYYVTAKLPAGQELYDYVEVREGLPNKALLKPDFEDESPHEWQAAQHYLVAQQTNARASKGILEALGGEPVEAKLRSIQGNILNQDYLISEPQNWVFNYGDNLADFEIDGTNKIQFAQLLQPNAPALNMALPAFKKFSCKLVVVRQPDGRFTFDAHLKNSAADMLLRYSQKGFQEQASLTAKALDKAFDNALDKALVAQRLLEYKVEDPIAASVGAYSLLRFGMLEYLHEWTENLRNWFKWLPDGSAIRGEHYARGGQHQKALQAFLELSERGLPLFSDGLSYAVDRLRVYTSLKEIFSDINQHEQARSLLETLQATAACTDFREPFTTFSGLVPHQPDNKLIEEVVTVDDALDLAQIFI